MRQQVTTTLVVGPSYIGQEEIEVLNDIVRKCFVFEEKAHRAIINKILNSVGATSFDKITEDDFEIAFNTAIGILHSIGEDILYRRHRL